MKRCRGSGRRCLGAVEPATFQPATCNRIHLQPLPASGDLAFRDAGTGKRCSAQAAQIAWEQGARQRWQVVALWITAVLEAAAAEIATLEEALQLFSMLPDGRVVGARLAPKIEAAYQTGRMPLMPLDGCVPSAR